MFCTSNSASQLVWLELFGQPSIVLNVCEVGSDASNSKRPARINKKTKFKIFISQHHNTIVETTNKCTTRNG